MLQVTENWNIITNEFLDAVQDLKVGEIIHDEPFQLFEAMSAIEMMDPKMDVGMLCNRGTKRIKSFDLAVSDGLLKLNNFTNSELIGIIDASLASIVSWLDGHSLAQTVFTNLYLHKPHNIEDRTLKVFSMSIYKLLEIIKEFIDLAMVYEEEDYQPINYGYHLVPDISEQRILGLLKEIEEELHKKSRNKQQNGHVTAENTDEIMALYARIKFVRVFYQILTMLLHHKDDLQSIVSDCQRLLMTTTDALFIMKSTIYYGYQQGQFSEHTQTLGFEPLINQRLLPPTFPRYTKLKPRNEALMYFESVIERIKIICKMHGISSFHQMLDFFIEFSKGNPCILSRSVLQVLYLRRNSTILGPNMIILKESLQNAVKLFISPPVLLSSAMTSNQQTKAFVDTFFLHCTKPFANLLQLCGFNRARQRDKLADLLRNFAVLQNEAEKIDSYIYSISVNNGWSSEPNLACFGTWILYHTLRIMIMYLLTGFELELYSTHEFCYIYWYLHEFIYGWLISTLTTAANFLGSIDMSKKNKKVKKKFKEKSKLYQRDVIYFQALQNMCGGYFKALIGFRIDKKLTMPCSEFDNERVRFEHRFAPFHGLITPPPVQYYEYKDVTAVIDYSKKSVDSVYWYTLGSNYFQRARQLLDTILPTDAEVTTLLKICKMNYIVLKLLNEGHKRESSTPPEFDFSSHKHFPIIKLV